MIQSLRQELANNRERHIQELDPALRDAERRAQQPSPVCAAASTQPYATPVEKKTLHAVAAVAQAAPVPVFRLPEVLLGSSVKSRNKVSSAMVVPVRRRLRTKTPPAAAHSTSSKSGIGEPNRIKRTSTCTFSKHREVHQETQEGAQEQIQEEMMERFTGTDQDPSPTSKAQTAWRSRL